MITIFNIKKNTSLLTDSQKAELLRCIAFYAYTEEGKWLKNMDYASVEYLWKYDLEGSAIMAARPLTGNSVILQPNGDNSNIWVQCIASAAIHELRHMYQRMHLGTLVYCILAPFGRIPGLEEKAPLEKDAFKHQDAADKCIHKNA